MRDGGGFLPKLARQARHLLSSDSMGWRAYLYSIGLITAGFAVVDLAWYPESTIRLPAQNWIDLTKAGFGLCAVWLVGNLIDYRLRNDPSKIASAFRHGTKSLRLLIIAAASFIPLAIVSTLFMYMASATQRPLVDPWLSGFDHAIGFRWPMFLEAMNRPIIAPLLILGYHALGPQVPLILGVHALRHRLDKVLEFTALMAVSSVFTGGLMALFPAEGAYAYFQPSPEQYSHFTAHAGMWHFRVLEALRSGQPFDLMLAEGSGLVTFPSFHTALGIMCVYAVRDIRWLLWPLVVLNALMIVATMPEGGHHLIDVIVGAVIGIVSVFIVSRMTLPLWAEAYRATASSEQVGG